MNDLQNQDLKIEVIQGKISFPEYERLRSEAVEVAERVASMDVTEDNIKETKKILAKVNKSVKRLEDNRIAIKKEMLKPYNEFEVLVKEIVSIVKDADGSVRDKVRELEEVERQNKEIEIKALWNLRSPAYEFDFVTFDDFMEPAFLLKSATVSKTEEAMVDFLERINSDLKVIDYMGDDRVLRAYKDVLSVDKAIEIVKDLDESKRQLEGQEVISNADPVEEVIDKSLVTLKIKKSDLDIVEFLFEKHCIDYNII